MPSGGGSVLFSLERPDLANLEAILHSASVDRAMNVSAEERGLQPVDTSYEAKKARFETRCFKTTRGKLKFHAIDPRYGRDSVSNEECVYRRVRGLDARWQAVPERVVR